MIHSMTAFARVQKQIECVELCWEIRAVNHRYLDVSFRLPEVLRFLEPQLRTALKDCIFRGKLECQLKYQDKKEENQSMLINKGLVNALVDLSAHLSSEYHLANDLGVSEVLSWPGAVGVQQQDIDSFCPGVLLLFDEAISQLSAVRAQEGAALKHHIEYRLEHLTNQILCAQNYAHEQVAGSKVRLLARLRSLELEVSEGRVDQEVALMLARMDVAEELDRLTTHVAEVQRILNHESSAGRRLDFLMQELNREANTLSSKSVSSELTQCAIEMKVLIEQMREQIQNIE